jgi:hypothetical protein
VAPPAQKIDSPSASTPRARLDELPPVHVDLAELTALPALLRELQARVAVLEAKVTTKSEAEALLDVAGAASMLHMTPAAVRAAAYRGSLPCVRVGTRPRVRPSDLLPS